MQQRDRVWANANKYINRLLVLVLVAVSRDATMLVLLVERRLP
jgi:hypothetical protein